MCVWRGVRLVVEHESNLESGPRSGGSGGVCGVCEWGDNQLRTANHLPVSFTLSPAGSETGECVIVSLVFIKFQHDMESGVASPCTRVCVSADDGR